MLSVQPLRKRSKSSNSQIPTPVTHKFKEPCCTNYSSRIKMTCQRFPQQYSIMMIRSPYRIHCCTYYICAVFKGHFGTASTETKKEKHLFSPFAACVGWYSIKHTVTGHAEDKTHKDKEKNTHPPSGTSSFISANSYSTQLNPQCHHPPKVAVITKTCLSMSFKSSDIKHAEEWSGFCCCFWLGLVIYF